MKFKIPSREYLGLPKHIDNVEGFADGDSLEDESFSYIEDDFWENQTFEMDIFPHS